MSPEPPELLERMYRRLFDATADRGEDAGTELTIGAVYRDMIPYRGVRAELGVFELAQYEHALLRLLAGEGGFVGVRDEHVRREIAAELDSPNPILGIYRDYAGVGVELLVELEVNTPAPRPTQDSPAAPLPQTSDEPREILDVADLFADDDPGSDEREWENEDDADPLPEITVPPPRPVPADATRVALPATPPNEGGPVPAMLRVCLACQHPLPDIEGLQFCPQCGANQTEVPCDRCGTPIQSTWNFCIRCGAPRPRRP